MQKWTVRALILAFLLVLLPAPALAEEGQPAPAHNGYLVAIDESRPVLFSLADEGLEPVDGLAGVYRVESLAQAEALLAQGIASYAEPDIILEPLDDPDPNPNPEPEPDPAPNDARYADQWTLSAVGYSAVYGTTLTGTGLTGTGVTIAVIDSGIDPTHEEYDGLNISSLSRNFLGNGTEPELAPAAYDRDQRGHGSFVTSQIATETNNELGLASLAPSAELMVLRCISYSGRTPAYDDAYDANSGAVSVVAAAICYAADNGADVINLSLGTEIESQTLNNAVAYALEKGVILVAAAGNKGTNVLSYPASCEGVISVGSLIASQDTFTRSYFSQYNAHVDLAAPGSDVLGIQLYPNGSDRYTDYADTYRTGSGTSYASPVVAALAALARQAVPTLDAEGVLRLLAASSTDLGTAGRDDAYGYGMVKADALAQALAQSYGITYTLHDDENALASLPAEAPVTYALGEEVTLPVPTRTGYLFTGWYFDEACTLPAGDSQPANTVGPLLALEGGGHEIGAMIYHAGWAPVSLTVPASVTVCGDYPAVREENSYAVTLPVGTVASLDALKAEDIAVTAQAGASSSTPATTDAASGIWTFTVTPDGQGSEGVDYTLTVRLSELSIPAVTPELPEQSGTAGLASLDGLTAVAPYQADVKGWFTGATGVVVRACDGGGTAEIVAEEEALLLRYTPGGDDYVGRTVTLRVGGVNDDFASPDSVTVTVTLVRAASNSTLSLTAAAHDWYTGGALTVRAGLYDNTFLSLLCDSVPMTAAQYTAAVVTDSQNDDPSVGVQMDFTLPAATLNSLSLGEHTLTFDFSAGEDATLTLTVSDSAPRYTVTFYLDQEPETEAYDTRESVRVGASLGTLPATPTRSGYLFTGWYLADGSTRVTSAYVVTGDASVYAAWTVASAGGGGGGGGGFSGGGGSTAAPTQAEAPAGASAFTADDLPARLTAQSVLTFAPRGRNTAVALTQETVAAIEQAGASLVVAGTGGQMTLSAATLAAIGAEEGAQVVFTIAARDATAAERTAAGISPAEELRTFAAEIEVIPLDGDPYQATDFPAGLTLTLAVGEDWANAALGAVHLHGGVALETIETHADAAGNAPLTVRALSSFLVYLRMEELVLPFGDVAAADWFYADLQTVYARGLMTGVSDVQFAPQGSAQRAMLAAVLHRLSGEPTPAASAATFTDLPDGQWYTASMRWAVGAGVLQGYGDGRIGPLNAVTREQFAAMLYRYAAERGLDVTARSPLSTFSDGASCSVWAEDALGWAVANGVLQGRDDGRLDPRTTLVRAEMAAMLARFLRATGL